MTSILLSQIGKHPQDTTLSVCTTEPRRRKSSKTSTMLGLSETEGGSTENRARNVNQRKREVKGLILARRVIVVITMKGMRDGGKSDGAALILEFWENLLVIICFLRLENLSRLRLTF